MSEEQSSYRQIMKATSIFGGVQVFNILITIIRTKFVSVLLGPLGMGVFGLLTSTAGLIQSLTNFGLSTSAVRDISEAYASGNKNRIAIVVKSFRRIVWITGLLGSSIVLIFAPWLSDLAFGNKDYTLAFVFISGTLLLNQISSGQSVLLRGTRQIKYLAKSSLIGSVLGLLTSIPFYYLWGIDGIVPAIIVTAITSLILTWYFSRKIEIEPIRVSKVRTIAEGKGMVKLGFMISLNGLIVTGASYIVRIFISQTGTIEDVGLYNAGFAIITTYVGLVFTAMSTDYYPRLAAVSKDNEACKTLINQQAEIAILIIAPLITIFLVFINVVIIALYSTKFIPINDMILFAAMGMLFKAGSWSIAFVFMAKGDGKLFFWNELIANLYLLILNLIGYYLWGLMGMGVSFLIGYLLYFIQVFYVTKIKYEFEFNSSFIKLFSIQMFLILSCFLVIQFFNAWLSYGLGSVLIIISFILSFKGLDQRINIKSIIKQKFSRLYE